MLPTSLKASMESGAGMRAAAVSAGMPLGADVNGKLFGGAGDGAGQDESGDLALGGDVGGHGGSQREAVDDDGTAWPGGSERVVEAQRVLTEGHHIGRAGGEADAAVVVDAELGAGLNQLTIERVGAVDGHAVAVEEEDDGSVGVGGGILPTAQGGVRQGDALDDARRASGPVGQRRGGRRLGDEEVGGDGTLVRLGKGAG